MTSPTATAEIERLAREATPGRRYAAGGYLTVRDPDGPFAQSIYHLNELGQKTPQAPYQAVPFANWKDAAYYAAVSPDVVLGMIAALRAAEARAQYAEKYMRDWRQGDLQGVMVHLDAAIARAEAAEAERDAARAALDGAPILSKYHGQTGFELFRFCDDYERWRITARAALQSTSAKEGG